MLLLLSFFFISFQNIFASRKHFNTQYFSHTTYCNRFSLLILLFCITWSHELNLPFFNVESVSHRKEEEACSYLEQTNWTSAFNFSKIGLHCRWFSLNLSSFQSSFTDHLWRAASKNFNTRMYLNVCSNLCGHIVCIYVNNRLRREWEWNCCDHRLECEIWLKAIGQTTGEWSCKVWKKIVD